MRGNRTGKGEGNVPSPFFMPRVPSSVNLISKQIMPEAMGPLVKKVRASFSNREEIRHSA